MNIPASIPLTITPEAAEHVEKLGMRAELERMLEYLATQIAGVREIRVVVEPPYDTDPEEKITIEVTKDLPPRDELDPAFQQWQTWCIDNFPPDVLWNIGALIGYGGADAR